MAQMGASHIAPDIQSLFEATEEDGDDKIVYSVLNKKLRSDNGILLAEQLRAGAMGEIATRPALSIPLRGSDGVPPT